MGFAPSIRSPLAEAVTFDCWGTLIHERDTHATYGLRVSALARAAQAAGARAGGAREALDRAWQRHWELWHAEVVSGPREIAGWALAELGVACRRTADELANAFAEAALGSEIVALTGARTTLERLARAGVRRALICDTGLTPGRVVRRLLARAGLLDLLEVLVFSDEAGVPKPNTRVFHAALGTLGVPAAAALHVGDLRRTDVAGARAAGMRTVRIRDHHDDRSDHPDADHVADSHPHLCEILELEG